MIVPCECGAKLKIDDAKIGALGVKVRCPRCGNVLPVQRQAAAPIAEPKITPAAASPGALVLVAHDSEAVRDTICSILTDAGFGVDTAADGVEALKKCEEIRPSALVLDVGLPGIYGFELCERLKSDDETRGIKIILLSSVYDMRRYKRTPVSLYGADDYIEKHHIPDYLPAKLQKLLFPEPAPAPVAAPAPYSGSELPEMAKPPAREFEPSFLRPEQFAQFEEERREPAPSPAPAAGALQPGGSDGNALIPESFSLDASIFQKEECDIPKVEEGDPEAVEKARRFARIIVSDIALYNQEAVAEGIRNGTFYDLLKTDVDEGRDLYEKRVPAVIKAGKDYYQEAFDNFIRAQQKNVR